MNVGVRLCDSAWTTPYDKATALTHWCSKPSGHSGQHACDICGVLWPGAPDA